MVNGAVVDELLARTSSGGTTAWYLTDKLDSVRDVVSSAGSVLDHIVYDSFGNITTETSASNGDRFKYSGMQYDATAGEYYDHARWYGPSIGRFSSVDPAGFRTRNPDLYEYVDSSSPNGTDSSGLVEDDPSSLVPTPTQTAAGGVQSVVADTVAAGLNAATQTGVGMSGGPQQEPPVNIVFSPKNFRPGQRNAFASLLTNPFMQSIMASAWQSHIGLTGKPEVRRWVLLKQKTMQINGKTVQSVQIMVTNMNTFQIDGTHVGFGAPPNIEGWVLFGTFHTHAGGLIPSGNPYTELFGIDADGQIFSYFQPTKDYGNAAMLGVPGATVGPTKYQIYTGTGRVGGEKPIKYPPVEQLPVFWPPLPPGLP